MDAEDDAHANSSSSSGGEEEEPVVASTARWVCDACGCHTNAATDPTCTICGTHPSVGPSAMRRAAAGSAALAAAAAGYSAAVRGSNHNNDNHWTFRSGIAYNAASAATDHNNNGNNWTFRSGMASNATSAATSAARRAMAAGILGAGGGEEDPDDLSLGDDDLWESVLQGVGELGQQQQHPLPHRHAAVHQLHQYHRRLSRSNNLSSNNNNNNIANGLPNLLDGAAVTNNNNARNNNNTRLGGGGEANSNRQRFYEAARAFSLAGNHRELLFGQAPSAPPVVLSAADANALLRAATANAALYQPQWSRNINSSCNATAAQRHASTAALDTDATQMQVDEQLPSADTVSAASSPAASTNDNCRAAIQVGSGMEGDANNNIAHVPIGAAEGLAIRAAEPLPRTDRTGNDANNNPFSSFRLSSPAHTNATTATTTAGWNPSDDDNTPHRRVFGFRVAFDHPTSGNVVGANMGGCYLIGVTTSSYTRFGEQDSLRQSPFFWGVEDGGQVFEGPRSGQQQPRRLLGLTATENRSSSSSATTAAAAAAAFYAMDGIGGSTSSASTTVAAAAASRAMNEHSVLFGARQVVTIVCDMDLRTLTFWREETLLGTLVTNLPRNGNLYPVVVPFNCGVTVAITGLGNNPLSLLQTFATNWKKVQHEKNEEIRRRLTNERDMLINGGKPSPKLRNTFIEIFNLYSQHEERIEQELSLIPTMASRLWYRCGLKLSKLNDLLKTKDKPFLSFLDFIGLIEQVLEEDEARMSFSSLPLDEALPVSVVEVGDKVELADGFEKYGDAVGGPLQVGDRGVVVELQRGPNGEKRSVRVLHSGRRWWYQPQAIVSERSGLIESPGVWFVNGILRAHGFDHKTLDSMIGVGVTPLSWRIGDVVAPLGASTHNTVKKTSTATLIGRVVSETPNPSSSLSLRNRQSGTVAIEFVGRSFASAMGIKPPSSHSALETRRVRTSKLVHSSEIQLMCTNELYISSDEENQTGSHPRACKGHVSSMPTIPGSSYLASSVNEKVLSDIAATSRFERNAIDSLKKECKKSAEALACVFSAGLPDAIMAAIKIAERQMNCLESQEDLPDKLTSIGDLVNGMTGQLFGERKEEPDGMDVDSPISSPEPVSARRSHAPITYVGDRRRARESTEEQLESGSLLELDEQAIPLDQRTNMLLSLMSRANHRSGPGSFLNDFAQAGIESMGNLPRNGRQPFVFGSSNGLPDFNPQALLDRDGQQSGREHVSESEERSSSMPISDDVHVTIEHASSSFLDSVLRRHCYLSHVQTGSNKQNAVEYAVCVRRLANDAILLDSVDWVVAIVDMHIKKGQLGSSQRSSAILRNLADEEGSSLLSLAICFGCSASLINRLIGWGATVNEEAIQKAAMTDQPMTLSLLLQHSAFKEGVINQDLCSEAVRRVLAETKSRQSELDKQMRENIGEFLVQLLEQIFKLGLMSRRLNASRVDMCSKVICEILVGNVLLRALQWDQSCCPSDRGVDQMLVDTCSKEKADIESSLVPSGLLGSLPCSVVEDFLFAKKSNVTTFLLLCEDYLCSKDMSDISAGLEFLSVLLTKFPQLRSSFEMKRFGMAEFVSNHNVLASNRIADILSKQLTIGLDVSVNRPNAGDIPPEQTPNMTGGAVLCPKKHAAALHITKHSSFRCDICGCAVPKGEYIFGCRQCDYDECLHCTLRDEKRTLFVQMMIRGVSSNCSRILALTNDVDEIGDLDDDDVVKSSAKDHELQALSVRLLRRNVDALKELGILLDESGRISIHEFISIVLPSLHASLIGTSHGCDESVNIGSTHRNKKARAARFSSIDSSDARLEYCREALRCMIADQDDVVKSVDGLHENEAGKEMDDNPNTADEGEKVNISYSPIVSEFLRRLHQVLSFYEGVQVLSTSVEKLGGLNSTANAGDLQALTKPIELQLSPSEFNNSGAHVRQSVIFAEPLIPFADLQRHILRTYRIFDPLYLSHCKRLASDSAIIVERSICKHTMPWRFATVVGFDEKTGAHAVRYASAWKRGQERQSLHITEGSKGDLSCLRFYGVETALVLAARQYYIIFRKASPSSPDEMIDAKHSSDEPAEIESDVNDDLNSLSEAFGTRVESNCGTNSSWTVLTLVGSDSANSSVDRTRYVLVSDDGELFSNVAADQVRAQRSLARDDISLSRRPVRGIGEDRHSLFPFFATARYLAESDSVSFSRNKSKSLKRSWSALALVEDMRPVDLKLSRDTKSFTRGVSSSPNLVLRCRVDESEFQCVVDAAAFQRPPQLNVQFSAHEKLPGMTLAYSPEKTLVYALKELNHKQNKWSELLPKPRCNLFFSVKAELIEPINTAEPDTLVTKEPDRDPTTNGSIVCENRSWPLRRSRKLSARSLSNEDEDDFSAVPVLCEGVDEICVQCMEVISLISECADDPVTQRENDVLNLPGFANPTLTNKLTEQLDDVLCVVGAALPEWCISAPSFAPRVFSYESRRLLMERAAFGPSRSTLKQQEVKVNVGRLRQRMASLRARAVELVGEAFAGGAEDPTALQLQADELYGMEEALASRVRAAFRAAKWHEHSLQVAKAAVRRERLLADAAAVMESYSVDSSVCRRRLEVRFEGESGFDAASGDEAGVTRGFYADVAEALVSAENVAGVYCPSPCGSTAVADAAAATKVPPSDIKETEDEWKALPFWIPDMDSSSLVIIPSPRADKKSGIGLFPRPIPHYHPQFEDVITQFRFMGRLFAAAMRDGFMFPLPLSCSFLKLVLMESDSASKKDSYNVPLLRSSDLPRPGFLGGEVYATDHYICGALERLNSSDPPLSRHELKRRYEEIATDKNFARVAFGRTYDCSFEEYFQDRTFVDPLDPAQDANAVPLCPKGHLKSVNIFNVRDWVAAAKSFMLHDGVIHQALAFRRGINDFFSVDYLRVFTPEELQRDVCGLGDDVENWSESSIRKLFKLDGGKGATEALVAVAAIGGEGGAAMSRRFGPSSPTIGFLVKALIEASPTQRRQFLSFVTSVPIVTPGRIEVVPILSPNGEFLPMCDPSCLPRANTCSRRLYLPRFEAFENFSHILWAVVREESKFKGFYEWRGN